MYLCRACCHKQRIVKLLSHCVFPFGFRQGKTENFRYQFRAIFTILIILLNTRDRKPNLFLLWTLVGGRVIPSLARVLLCLVRIGVAQMSWAVRYLDKLRWRAMSATSIDFQKYVRKKRKKRKKIYIYVSLKKSKRQRTLSVLVLINYQVIIS